MPVLAVLVHSWNDYFPGSSALLLASFSSAIRLSAVHDSGYVHFHPSKTAACFLLDLVMPFY